jgi:hypothetical protein
MRVSDGRAFLAGAGRYQGHPQVATRVSMPAMVRFFPTQYALLQLPDQKRR